MSNDFNPYRKWLGIPKNRMPANHYDILGVSLDEEDPEVIKSAAEQRRSYVEQQRGLGHDKAVKEILYQLDEAEMTLLDFELRREYDKRLKLFRKRKKRRQVDRVPGRSRVRSRPGKTVGEDSGFAGQFAAIVGILCVAFGAMYWWANRTYEPATGVTSPSGEIGASLQEFDRGGENPATKPSAMRQPGEFERQPAVPPARLDVAAKKDKEAVRPVEPNRLEVEIVETKTQDWRRSSTDFAKAEGNRFSVGMGNQGGGYGIAAYGWRVKNAGGVEVNAKLSGDIKVIDQDSFVGVVVDFLGANGQWTKRVGINGFPQRLNRNNGVPNWGTRRKPDSIMNVESTGDLKISLEEHAPSDWTGESWVTVLMQNTGLNTGASGTVRFVAKSNEIPVTKSDRRMPSGDSQQTVTRVILELDESGEGRMTLRKVPDQYALHGRDIGASVPLSSEVRKLTSGAFVTLHDFGQVSTLEKIFSKSGANVRLSPLDKTLVLKPKSVASYGQQFDLPVQVTCDVFEFEKARFYFVLSDGARKPALLQLSFRTHPLVRDLKLIRKGANGKPKFELLVGSNRTFDWEAGVTDRFKVPKGVLANFTTLEIAASQEDTNTPPREVRIRRLVVEAGLRM